MQRRILRVTGLGLAGLLVSTLSILSVSTANAASAHKESTSLSNELCGSATTQRSPRQGRFLGIVPPVSAATNAAACGSNARTQNSEASGTKKYNGKPPLINHGGPVMGTLDAPGDVTITPIYWDPDSTISASYKSVINGFIANLAADSGKLTNVYSDDLQYGINYNMTAGAPITTTDPFPSNGCTPDSGSIYDDNSGYSNCLTNAQIQTEVENVLATDDLSSDLSHLWIVFLPKGTESCFTSADGSQQGSCTINSQSPKNGFCGYHSSSTWGTSSDTGPIFADMPFPIYNSPVGWTCSPQYGPGDQSPNAQLDADVEIGTTSHEINESITDPDGTTWYDSNGLEIADECDYIFGGNFGGVSGAEYNQTINGAHYFIQEQFSNEDFQFNKSTSCNQSVDMPITSFKVSPKTPKAGATVTFNAAKSKGTISSYAWNFGDGSPAGSGVSTTHVYSTSGVYPVTLTITDSVGLQLTTGTGTETITVKPSRT